MKKIAIPLIALALTFTYFLLQRSDKSTNQKTRTLESSKTKSGALVTQNDIAKEEFKTNKEKKDDLSHPHSHDHQHKGKAAAGKRNHSPADQRSYEKTRQLVIMNNKVLRVTDMELVRRIPYKNESILMIQTNFQGQEREFNALADENTGKILKTWNHSRPEQFKGSESYSIGLPNSD